MRLDQMLPGRSPDALLLIAMPNIIHYSVAHHWLHAIEIIQIGDIFLFVST
jgi:hypothetical protein